MHTNKKHLPGKGELFNISVHLAIIAAVHFVTARLLQLRLE